MHVAAAHMVIGQCDLPSSEIDRLYAASRYRDILNSRGSFVVIFDDGETTHIISSPDLGSQAYYAIWKGKLFWGRSVGEVARSSGIPFEWNYEATANYLIFDHVLDGETIHSRVFRTLPATILSFDGRRLIVDSSAQEQLRNVRQAGLEIGELRDRVAEDWRNAPGLLCMTAGMDSRLLLAMLLSADLRPDLLIAGRNGSFDVEVASRIAREFGLRFLRCEIGASDFLEHADAVTHASGGSLPVSHWPGSLIAAHGAGSRLLLGFGGEAMRSYYDDDGMPSLLRSGLPARGFAAGHLLRHKVGAIRLPGGRKSLAPALAAELGAEKLSERTLRICRRRSRFGDALDGFYRTQYLANKTVLDLAVMSRFGSWRAPLLGSDWLDQAERTPRWRKLGSVFHRQAIIELAPELQRFPEELRPCGTMGRWPPRTYFNRQLPKVAHFVDQRVYASNQLRDLVRWADEGLSDILPPGMLTSLWESRDGRALGLKLAALGLWKRSLG